jgi:hypothetical protein
LVDERTGNLSLVVVEGKLHWECQKVNVKRIHFRANNLINKITFLVYSQGLS